MSPARRRLFAWSCTRVWVQGMLEDLHAAPEGSIVLLHACAHNPTGVDPTLDEWRRVLDVVQRRRLLPYFDMVYQARCNVALLDHSGHNALGLALARTCRTSVTKGAKPSQCDT